jgi:hypothetical protein
LLELYQSEDGLLRIQGVDDPYYSPFDMFAKVSRELNSAGFDETGASAQERDAYNAQLDVISSLKVVEKAYIEEVLVTPNIFDTYTGTGRKDTMFEIFRRYPVLFVIQHMIRKASRMHGVKLGAGLITLMILDIYYMMLLRVGQGQRAEDILESYEDNPVKFVTNYAVRLPIMGRWLAMAAAGVDGTIWATQKGRTEGGFIPFGALGNALT